MQIPSRTERRAVFVYFHGGGYDQGSAAVPIYDGEGLAAKGLVVVTFNYRLGRLGFLAHPDLTREAPYKASGNYGLLDKIAVLHWVRANIGAFGGDPNRVTIAGQSAGAQDVHHLTASPLAKGLFHRAIIQSGSTTAQLGRGQPMASVEAGCVRLATAKGADSIDALRAMTWEQLTAPLPAGNADPAGAPRCIASPVVDGYVLPRGVGPTFEAGEQNDVPTLTGWNVGEGSAQRRLPADMAQTLSYLWALRRSATAKTRVYTYSWTHPLPGPDAATYGAFHTAEVPYVLNVLEMSPRPFTSDDHALAALTSSYWANFAATGDPNSQGLPTWLPTSEQTPMTLEIGARPRMVHVAGSPERLAELTRKLAP